MRRFQPVLVTFAVAAALFGISPAEREASATGSAAASARSEPDPATAVRSAAASRSATASRIARGGSDRGDPAGGSSRGGSFRVECSDPPRLRLRRFEDGSAQLLCGPRLLVRVSVPG